MIQKPALPWILRFAATRVAALGVTTFRIAADLQRLLLCRVGVIPTSLRFDRAGLELTSSTAVGIRAAVALEIGRIG